MNQQLQESALPFEISEPKAKEAFKKALEDGSKEVHRTRLMIVGQERVGKTSLMKNLTHQSFNRNELSTEGITSSLVCNIDIKHATCTSWRLHQEGGVSHDPTSFKEEYEQCMASEVDFNIQQGIIEDFAAFYEQLMWNSIDFVQPGKESSEEQATIEEESSEEQTTIEEESSEEQTTIEEESSEEQKTREKNSSKEQKTMEKESSEEQAIMEKDLTEKHTPVPAEADKIKVKKLRQRQASGGAEEPIVLSIWDFAGQDLYYTTHQTFLSSRAIYVIVFNLCHDLDKPVPHPDCSTNPQAQSAWTMTPLQYLDFWMQSVYTYTKENASPHHVRLDQKSPPIFLVGTHRNSVGGEDISDQERKLLINDKFTRIRQELCNKPYWRFMVNSFYAIENSLPYSRKISHLRDHIESVARKEPYMGEEIPLRWLLFDRNKMTKVAKNIKRGTETPVLTLKQIKDAFGIEDETELLTMLKFYHDLGHIIYFGGDGDQKSQALKDVVILDPQWLIDVFKKVITVTPPQRQMTDHVKSWNRLKEDGILEDILIDYMWQDLLPKKQALLDIMDKFDLLCERIEEGKKTHQAISYYVPSMLQRRTSVSQLEDSEHASVFFVDFQGFLPDGLFHRLVVRALRWSQNRGGTNPVLHYDRGSFYVDDQHEFTLQMDRQNNLSFIKVNVTRAPVIHTKRSKQPKINVKKAPSPDVTKEVHDFVEENLQNLKDMWIKRINYSLSVECPCRRSSLHLLSLDKCLEKAEVPCRIEKLPQRLIKTDQFQAMFNQESSEEEPITLEERLEPLSNIHLEEIVADLGPEWKRLATNLGFKEQAIYRFEADTKCVHDAIFCMLVSWTKKFKKSVKEKQEDLAKALRKIDKLELADKVLKYPSSP
ncbi:uncharacterized protein LOC110982143 isoform X2 [Acanthaster planci]|nr:uncharacterized protein LOC110982143 isoform X2 [Acanthaster planci]